MENTKRKWEKDLPLLAKILLPLVAVLVLTACGNSHTDRTRWKDITGGDGEQEVEAGYGETDETENEAEREKDEEEKESRDLGLIRSLSGALSTAIADAKATGTRTITISAAAASLDQASSDGKDTAKVLDVMEEVIGEQEVRLTSAAGSGQDIVCYYDTSKNVVAVYVEQHDDTVGGSEVQIRDGVIVQNCKYHDHAPLMQSNGALPQN